MNLQQIILLILSLSISTSFADLPPLTEDFDLMRKSMLLCCVDVVENYFQATETIALALPLSGNTEDLFDQEFLHELHSRANWTIFLKRYSNIYRFVAVNRKKTQNYILHVKNQEDVYDIIQYLRLSQWNSQAKFIVLINEIYENPSPIVLDIANTLWNYHIINAVIFAPRFNDTSLIDIHTWFPYSLGKCGKNFNETIIINSCQNGEYTQLNNLYPEKVPLDLNGCAITVRTVLWPPFVIPPHNLDRNQREIKFTEGLEIELMNTIAKAANFTIIYTISLKIQDWGLLYDNGTASSGLFKQLLDEQADIGIAAIGATVTRYNYLDYTNSYTSESITWCVPIAQEEPRWISLIKILQVYTWIATIGSFIVVSFIIWRISLIIPEESSIFKHISTCYLYTFSTSLCITIKTLPSNMYVRIVLLMWVIYSYTLCSAYQTSLISKLTQPEYEKQMKTVQQMFDSKMEFGYLNGLQIYFEDKSSYFAKKIIEEGSVCENAEGCIERVANDRDFAVAVPRDYLQYVSTGYYDKNRRLKIFWFKTDTVTYPIQMFSYKGFPLIGRINELTLRIKSGGFMKKWMSDTILSYMKNRKKQAGYVDETDGDGDNNDEDKVLRFEHMQGPFLLLICGLSISTIAFIGELLHFRIHKIVKAKRSK